MLLETEPQPAYFETLAELYGLEHIYYTDDRYRNDQKGQEAKRKVFENLEKAIAQGLLELRKISTVEMAEKYFQEDSLLKLLYLDQRDHRTFDRNLKHLIEQWLARQ